MRLILATIDKIVIHTLKNNKCISVQELQTVSPVNFIQCSPLSNQLVYLSSLSNYYSLQLKPHLNLVNIGKVED